MPQPSEQQVLDFLAAQYGNDVTALTRVKEYLAVGAFDLDDLVDLIQVAVVNLAAPTT